MANINPELLRHPEFQRLMHEDVEANFPFERLRTTPTVVFDRRGEEFWDVLKVRAAGKAVLDRIRSGDVIPVNADRIRTLVMYHAVFHEMLADMLPELPRIPTVIEHEGSLAYLEAHHPERVPGLWVKKVSRTKSGDFLSHRGQGVSIITEAELAEHIPENKYSFLQPFIIPPDRMMRDARVFVIGGEPVAGAVKYAKHPLSDKNLTGKKIPSDSQYNKAGNVGRMELLKGDAKDRAFEAARKIAAVFEETARKLNPGFTIHSGFGFGSIDFIFDTEGNPLPSDCDIGPDVDKFFPVVDQVASGMADYLRKLAAIGGKDRDIQIISGMHEKFTEKVVADLRENHGAGRVFVQDPSLYRVIPAFNSLHLGIRSTR